MNKDDVLKKAIDGISDKYIEEAYLYKRKSGIKKVALQVSIVAAIAAVIVLVYNLMLNDMPYITDSMLKVYAGENEKILETEFSVISTGSVTDNASVSGSPLMFYIENDNIKTVRYSCKNQFIEFYAPEQEYENSKNFTVDYERYGNNTDNDNYFYDSKKLYWNPADMVAKINEMGGIEALSTEERKDVIVLEICYKDGSEECYAIYIELNDNGKFYGKIQSYTISESDEFVLGDDSISYQEKVSQEMENAKECQELLVETIRKYTDNQINNIFLAAKEYYSDKYYMITDMVLTEMDVSIYAQNTEYEEDELVYIHVWGPEIDENTWRHMVLGSKDDWETCEIVAEGY